MNQIAKAPAVEEAADWPEAAVSLPTVASIHGFQPMERWRVSGIDATALLFQHIASNATLLVLQNDDPMRAFAVSVRTPALDSSGVTHVLEHLNLNGSRRFPMRDPFAEMSCSTFGPPPGAYTSPLCTFYPVASSNPLDFEHQVTLYLDAVLRPLHSPEAFELQRGHLQYNEDRSGLHYNGIIGNEMTRLMHDPEYVEALSKRQVLLPGSVYAHNASGDPRALAGLTYERLKETYLRYYQPANMLFVLYGRDDLERLLPLLDTYLEEERSGANLPVPPPDLSAVASLPEAVIRVPGRAGDPGVIDGLELWFRFDRSLHTQEFLVPRFLAQLLAAGPASYFGELYAESGLPGIYDGAYVNELGATTFFNLRLAAVPRGECHRAAAGLRDLLARLVEQGYPRDKIDGCINQLEYAVREQLEAGDRGYTAVRRLAAAWGSGNELRNECQEVFGLQRLKERLAGGDDFLRNDLRRLFLENERCGVIQIEHDPEYGARHAQQERAWMQALFQQHSPEQLAERLARADQIRAVQQRPEPPELLALVPKLRVGDVAPSPPHLPTEQLRRGAPSVLRHAIPSATIFRLTLALDAGVLPQALRPYLPYYNWALTCFGTVTSSVEQFRAKCEQRSGGFESALLPVHTGGLEGARPFLLISTSAHPRHRQYLPELLDERLNKAAFADPEEFRKEIPQAIREIARSAHRTLPAYLSTRLAGANDPAQRLQDMLYGLGSLQFAPAVLKELTHCWPVLQSRLETLHALLLRAENLTIHASGNQEQLDHFLLEIPRYERLCRAAEAGQRDAEPAPFVPCQLHEGIVTNAGGAAIGQLWRIASREPLHPAWSVAASLLGNRYLWQRLRNELGCYSTSCVVLPQSGCLVMLAGECQEIEDVMDVFRGAGDFLRQGPISQHDVESCIVNLIGALDRPRSPAQLAEDGLRRHLMGVAQQQLQTGRKQLLEVTLSDIREIGDVLNQHMAGPSSLVAAGPERMIQCLNRRRGAGLEIYEFENILQALR